MNRASSSRPSDMMPLRVADTNRMSMYTTPQSKQPSFGKLNMTKPPSATSDRRTTFFGARTSGVGVHRNSTFGGLGGSEKLKDTRPLHDKSFVQQCIRKLCEFLSEKGFPGAVSTKTLQSPSTKEFLKLFEFIYSQLDSTFQLPKSKVEEEVPRILKDLGYPFALSKSSMYSVGAPHTWPQVLGALIWLIDTVNIYCSRVNEGDNLLFKGFSEDRMNVEDGVERNKLYLDYIGETYNKFMQGADTFEEEDHVHLNRLKRLYNVDDGLLFSAEEKYRMLNEQVELLEKENQSDPLMNKRMEKLKLQTELQKLDTYHSNLETYKASLETKDARLTEEVEVTGRHLDSLKQEQAKLQHLLDNQKYTSSDIERINREKIELQQTISILNKAQEEAEKHVWQEEMGLATIKEKVELKLAEYHKLARKVKLIPASAENACGHDFEMKTTSMYQPGAMLQYKAQIQIPLRKMITDMEEQSGRLANKKLCVQESIDQMTSNILDKNNQLKQLREQIHKLDERLEQDMQEMALEEQKFATEKDSIENHQKILEDKVTHGYDDAVQKQKATQQQYHLVLQETSEERRTVTNNLASVCTTAANHVYMIEKFMEDQRSKLQRVTSKATEENQVYLQQLREMITAYISKANSV